MFISISQLLPAFIWISFSSVFFTTGDIILRYWLDKNLSLLFLAGIGTLCIGTFCLTMSFPSQNIAVASVIAILLNITLYLIASYFIFGDTINMKQAIGLSLGFAAIIILEAL